MPLLLLDFPARRLVEGHSTTGARHLGRLARQMRDDHAKLQSIVANPNIASNLSGLSEIQSRLETADRRSQQITSELAVLEAQKIDDQQITNFLAGFDELWQSLPPKEQVHLVRLLIESSVSTDQAAT